MTTHRFHPDIEGGDPEDAILWDDCERCDEHAANPTGLDTANLRALWHNNRIGAHPLTVNDSKATRAIDAAVYLAGQVKEVGRA